MNSTVVVFGLLTVLISIHVGEGCETLKHYQCAGRNMLCFRSKCIMAFKMPYAQSCTTNAECRLAATAGRQRFTVGCNRGQCNTLLNPELPNQFCRRQSDCSKMAGIMKFMCIRTACVLAMPTTRYCDRDHLCKTGESCINGVCYEPVDK
uniref:EB domain-containing protein n=1 Tax=Trichuris muris TaxID=70415 RepID=A0A5S6QJJ5_TRIMR